MYCTKKLLVVKRHIVFIFFLFLVLLPGNVDVSYGSDVTGVTDKSVKIGLMGDLTGPIADAWIPLADGAKAFFKMVNDEGGIHGRKIDYILEDDRYSIPLALSCFKKLVYRDKIFALQAASGVGHTAALIPRVEKEKIPLIAATGEKKFFIPARKYLFSGIPWYDDQSKLVVEYIFNDLKLKNPNVAIMYPDTASGKDARNAFRKMVEVYPVNKYKEVVFSLTALDYTSEVLGLKKWGPDVIFVHGLVHDTASIVKAAYRLGLSVPIIVDQYGCADEVLVIAGKAAKQLLAINCFGTWDDESTGVIRLRKAALAHAPKVHRRSAFYFQGWFAGMLFYEGFKNAGRNLTRETYLNGLNSIRDFDTEGICGIVNFSPEDHKAIDNQRFYKADIDSKKFVPITGWRKPKKYDF